jgi:hypothetical protein
MIQPDLAQIIEKAIAIRDKRAEMKEAYENADKPYKDAFEKLGNIAGLMLGTAQSVKTDNGTAYRTETMHVGVADREAWFEFVRENQTWDMLTTHVAKTQLQDWMEEHKDAVPPGLNLSFVKQVNFRKA